MDIENLRSTILDLITSEKCDICYAAGVQCRFKHHSKIRTVSFDHFVHIDQFPLPPEEFDCQLKKNPYLTDTEAEENARRLRALQEELNKLNH